MRGEIVAAIPEHVLHLHCRRQNVQSMGGRESVKRFVSRLVGGSDAK
jgi:hypothetical protein